MPATIRNVVDDAQELVGEVAGPGVQMYSDDRMFADAVRAFNMLFKKYNWRNYCNWLRLQLDGVTGCVTTNELQYVQDFEDFIAVRKDGSHMNLSISLRGVNPFQQDMLSGSAPRYWNSLNVMDPNYPKKRLYVLPKTSVGYINVLAKFYPVLNDAWDWQDTFYLDRDMLVYGTAWATLSSDDLNAAAADVAKNMMEMRYRDIQSQLASFDINFGPGGRSGIPDEWLVATPI
jgi:hypothetical protein